MLPEKVDEHISELRGIVERLLNQAPVSYGQATPASFPETRGVYVIFTSQGEVIRAGKTGAGNATLRERLYRNHLMGNQSGNLRAQLVASGVCIDIERAKDWIRNNCSVRFLEVSDSQTRANLEHFILAVLQPRFCDDNKSLGESLNGGTRR